MVRKLRRHLVLLCQAYMLAVAGQRPQKAKPDSGDANYVSGRALRLE